MLRAFVAVGLVACCLQLPLLIRDAIGYWYTVLGFFGHVGQSKCTLALLLQVECGFIIIVVHNDIR